MTTRAIKVKGEQFSFLAHADSAEQLVTGTLTGETPISWNLKVKGTYLYWVDDDGAERRKEGTLTGGSRAFGSVIVHGEDLYFGDIDGNERYVRAITTLELGSLKDTWITSSVTTYNGGSDKEGRVINYLAIATDAEMFLAFDMSTLAGKTITSAILRLCFFASSREGDTIWVYKILPAYDTWVESQLTYRIWKTGQSWAVGGRFSTADFVTFSPDGVSAVVPALAIGYMEWDLTAMVQDAIDNSVNLNIVLMGQSPETGTIRYDSKEAILSADRPKLTVIYQD